MLTKSERRFVRNPEEFNKNQVWVYRHRINKKITKFVDDIIEIIPKNDKLRLSLDRMDDLIEAYKTRNRPNV